MQGLVHFGHAIESGFARAERSVADVSGVGSTHVVTEADAARQERPPESGLHRFRPLVVVTEWILFAVLLGIFVLRGFLPGWHVLNTDFPNYYVAAALRMRSIPLDRAYEWIWFQRQKDHLGVDYPLVGFMPNPTMVAVPLLPIAKLPPLDAKRVWLVLNVGLLLWALWMLHGVTALPWRRILLLTFLCILPLQENFAFGQYYVVILLLVCGAYCASLRNRPFLAGVLLSLAAFFKLFPGVFLIFFLLKRQWRSVAGMLGGGVALTTASIAIFGWQVHRVWLIEVLGRSLHGDFADPYEIQWGSFSALWHKLFLFEPDLNPSPLLSSPTLYAIAQAVTVVILLFGFLVVTDNRATKQGVALQWATFVPLCLLLSSMPASYHYCLLIFTAIVALHAFSDASDRRAGIFMVVLFALASAPTMTNVLGGWPVLTRLFATLVLYVFLLKKISTGTELRFGFGWAGGALLLGLVLTISNLMSVRDRTQDYSRRISYHTNGYGAWSPIAFDGKVVLLEMFENGYRGVALHGGEAWQVPLSVDVLAAGGSAMGTSGYFEQSRQVSSSIFRFPNMAAGFENERIADGEQPTLSANGQWLAFLREQRSGTALLLYEPESSYVPKVIVPNTDILEVSVRNDGGVIAAAGPVSDPRLISVNGTTGEIKPLVEITGPARYPAISADETMLAFSRREWGSWQLIVRDLESGTEQQLTKGQCNATSPSWEDAHTLLYASDCGRGIALNAIDRVVLPH